MPDNPQVQAPSPAVQPTTSDVGNQIPLPEAQSSQAPPQSAFTQAMQPDVQQNPQAQQPQVQQPPADPRDAHPSVQRASILHRVAETLAGGPQIKTTIDPVTGETTREKVPLTSHQILTGALANILGGIGQIGTNLSNRMEGRAANPIQPLPTQVAQQKQAQQSQADFEQEQQTKVQQAKILNANLENQRLSYALRHEENSVLDSNIALHKDDLENYTNSGTVEASQVPSSQLLAKGYSPSKYLAIPDGHVPAIGPDGKQVVSKDGVPVEELTYSVVDGTTQVPMSQDAYDKFKQYGLMKGADDFKVPEGATVSTASQALMNYKIGLIDQTGREVNEVRQAAGLEPINIASEVKKNPGLLKSIESFHNSTSDDPNDQLTAIQRVHPGAAGAIKNLMGGDAALQKYAAANQQLPDNMTEDKARAILADTRTDPNSPAAKGAQAFLTGKRTDKAQTEKDKLQAARNLEDSDLQTTAKNVVAGNVAQMKDLASFRGDQKSRLYNMISDEAKVQGKDPKLYSPAMLDAKAKVLNDFADGKAADNILAFNTFLGHANDALSATGAMRGQAGSPLINRPLNWLRKNAADDPTFTSFQTALVPVRKEYMNFLNNNRAEHESDLKTMETVLSDTATPAQIETALKSLGESADIRLRELGNKYSNTIGEAYPNLVTPEGQQALQRMGVNSSLAKPQPAQTAPNRTAAPGNLPPLQAGFVRFKDSQGGVHDIPKANLGAAQQRDKGLTVLQGQ